MGDIYETASDWFKPRDQSFSVYPSTPYKRSRPSSGRYMEHDEASLLLLDNSFEIPQYHYIVRVSLTFDLVQSRLRGNVYEYFDKSKSTNSC
jgi:hypothetical protein